MSEKKKLSAVARWAIGLTVAGVAVAMLPFLVVRFGPGSERREYWSVAERISVYFKPISLREIGPGGYLVKLPRPDRTRVEVAKAVDTALWNAVFDREPDGTHRKLYAWAERFERTAAAELQTEAGCLRLVEKLERDFPDAYDYSWFRQLREMQDEGMMPRLTDLAREAPRK